MSAAVPTTPAEPVHDEFHVSARQMEMIQSPCRTLWVGCATKTGKTIAFQLWIAEGILAGEATAWCAPVATTTREAYEAICKELTAAEQDGDVSFNDTRMVIKSKSGGSFRPFTGQEPENIFGKGIGRFVIDEASRQPQAVFMNALTTISATNGMIRLAFNLDHGAKNWAIERLLRVQAMTPEERTEKNTGYMMFPTVDPETGDSFVAPDVMEDVRLNMPKALFDALYHAIIPESDVALFHNLDEIFSGPTVRAPVIGHTYVMGVDLARKHDYTVATVLDVTDARAVAAMRFREIDWTLQYEKIVEFAKTWRVAKTWIDQTGLGDPVLDALERRGLAVEGFMFKPDTKKALVEGLVIACDGIQFHASDDPQFAPHKAELMAFGYVFDKRGKITYGVSEHDHDDAAISLMLAWYGAKQGNYGTPVIRSLRERDEGIGSSRVAAINKNDFSDY